MDLDDIGYFGLPINSTVTPSVQSQSSYASASSRLHNPSTSRLKSKRATRVSVAAAAAASSVAHRNRTAWKQQHGTPRGTLISSQAPNKKKRGLPLPRRNECSGDHEDEGGELTTSLPLGNGHISRFKSLANADTATNTGGVRVVSSLDDDSIPSAKPNYRSNNQKEAKSKERRNNIQSFFLARNSSVQHNNHLDNNISALQHDFVTAASMMIRDHDKNEHECKTLKNTTDNRSNHGHFEEDELENFSDDELIEKESDNHKQAIMNCERDVIQATTTNLTDSDDYHRHSQERRRLNHIEFGIHRCILGHRILPSTKMKGSRLRYHGVERRVHEERLQHGTCGINILSRLVQRSCIPSSMTSISIASAMEKFVNSGNHWNISNTVELDTSNDHGDARNDASYSAVLPHSSSGDICAMSFDRDGILLATGDDCGVVRIYDFDDVYTLDMKKRNEISRLFCLDYSVTETISNERDENGVRSHVVSPSAARPVLSFNTGYRISSVLWSPYNQDHLAISFANQPETHIYDTASEETPIPCLRLLDSRHSRSEGISKVIFLPPLSSSTSTQLITGGTYGTVSLWIIPRAWPHRVESVSKHSAQCLWSISAFSSNREGVSDMMVLPTGGASMNKSSNTLTKPLVLVAGNGSSLTLLDTKKCTRKAFSATITPSVVNSWDLYQYTLRDVSTIYPDAKLPARNWIAPHNLYLLHHECPLRNSRIQIGIVLKCGWILIAEMSLPHLSLSSSSVNIQMQIVHHSPRIQCFNSSNVRLTSLGGLALQFSLPEIPIQSTNIAGQIWLADVKQIHYTLPSKDKYVLGEEQGTFTAQSNNQISSGIVLRHSGEGLILAKLGIGTGNRRLSNSCICARLPMSCGLPFSLAAHPSGEWIVVGCRRGGTRLVTMRKKVAQRRLQKEGSCPHTDSGNDNLEE